ncbi:MAG TPA: TetR/AcrR family transcriptional regulator [Rariglobus sp.]|nr:TetR/AcrR family transcriptional regulator [Rariglobus sp.]
MKTSRRSSPSDTRDRILAAAARIFARNGLTGATTRAIAHEAGVNEVTIFRHFKSKDRLLSAVVGQNFGTSALPVAIEPPVATHDLKADLIALAQTYEKLLTDNLPLVRTMLGEIHHHHRDHERQVFKAIFRPLKAALIDRLESARNNGDLKSDTKPALLADLFSGMLFTGVLRCSSKDLKLEYSPEDHLLAAVELVLRGAGSPSKGSQE